MIGIDTNILVRYLVQDDAEQGKKAANLIEQYSGKKESIFINQIVLCELLWVLERGYKYTKEQTIMVLKGVLGTMEFSFKEHAILLKSAFEYEESQADFSDILIGNLNQEVKCSKTFTFDKKASTLSIFTLIE